jgi:hypothetical protein
MTKVNEIYRGFNIVSHQVEGYVIKKDGLVVSSQPSMDFAYKFIDKAKKSVSPHSEESRDD